jgi:hypothetical protein
MAPKAAEWHGLPHAEIDKAGSKIPPRPARDPAPALGAEYVYPKVHFSGNYGSNFCSNFQEFWRSNLTKTTAEQLAWSAFGLCGHKIRYCDANGNEIA